MLSLMGLADHYKISYIIVTAVVDICTIIWALHSFGVEYDLTRLTAITTRSIRAVKRIGWLIGSIPVGLFVVVGIALSFVIGLLILFVEILSGSRTIGDEVLVTGVGFFIDCWEHWYKLFPKPKVRDGYAYSDPE